jgi:hypothetical protein
VCFVGMCLLENVKDGHALHSARAAVDRELASGGDISSVPGCSVRMAGGNPGRRCRLPVSPRLLG